MTRNIKITERQYQMLENLNEEEYTYLDKDDNTKPYTGYNEISPEGKDMDGITGPKKRVKTDDVEIKLTPQSWVAHNVHNRAFATMLRENNQTNQSNDFYDVKGFENNGLNLLSNNNQNDDLEQIPTGITKRLDGLLYMIKSSNLSPRKQGIILKKIIEELDCDTIPYQWKKELIYLLK